MIKHLTKEELLERVMALEDGTEITSELQTILMCPDNSDDMIETIKRANRMVCGSGKYDHRMTYASEPNCTRNDLVQKFIDTHKNVTDVHVPNIGIILNDLEHPIQTSGCGWQIKIAENGGFERNCAAWRLGNNLSEDSLMKEIESIIEQHKWVHTYILSIDEKNSLGDYLNVKRYSYVRMCGVTKEDLNRMKNSNSKDTVTWVDYMFAAGASISL